ncbi:MULTISPECIES: pyridoxamine 5'-phosphate oxidase family protein [unclassified Bradyrhizobium]|uniref:2Fe-2S iron-sulfur cluster-binding protein n=1 Tax=unclassified Bradyrhizobium TaxID=2631580 RepID=UPI001BA44E5D|nr:MULTISPECIES: pyridoxamine 5'-phosphate oxidase family protein [unclassified Bradyrhizobium]MBR1203327.1 pyridoxamine 5'-phosphate oxidase family protein [Bradyrhizobium sp. AUGA SZCCT0124]MBR1312990.1 pyridoxamine 5'-phosphate oxidase family protein [Bradyrhizobium sp. AUGA SZCCT0051]MBR1341348.1 pyridoxamine 5'-phosphate oxidase family protein [Bradyrhizobium sp. AUGA SZCCT0105]MBR1356714.1 pyridoxamine 5'-phosphate oxidase family protein [Bradyrhizobium sp. AUGA SZCCT0045]
MSDRRTKSKLATWHAGEIAIQQKVGVAEKMAGVGQRAVRDFMPDQHRDFFAQIPFIVVGSVDRSGDVWASLLAGRPGFISSPTPRSLEIDARPEPSDPASEGMLDGDAIGLLGIELHTRRRNRANGLLRASSGKVLSFELDQSFGNCPQYIQLRDFAFVREPDAAFTGDVEQGTTLDQAARDTIAAADTFFVASYAEREDRRQVDVSHRGGRAGFVRVGDDGTLTVPDFAGNLFFNTLGNILVNGKAGLVFVDFETGDMLQLTGDAKVILDSPEIAAFQGAERLWSFRTRRVVRRRGALPLRWAFQNAGWSPNALMTGDWAQAADRLRASERATQWRPFKVTGIVDESRSIRSFHLQPDDGAGLLPHQAGQHLPIRLTLPGSGKPVIRTYTLSVAPSDGMYRISVKRDGLASRHLHDTIHVDDIIEARAPSGGFTIDAREKRPAVLLAGGVGITPMLAMLRHVVYEGLRTRGIRPTFLFQAAHARAERAFGDELQQLADAAGGAVRIVRVLSDVDGAEQGTDYDAAGRIDMALLSRVLPFNDYDFYLCGPPQFTQSLYDALRGYNIADGRIHAEAFGPSSLVRKPDVVTTVPPRRPAATSPVAVAFTASMKEARWTPESGTLLELAEARGLSPAFSCREGNCGSCRTRLLAGAVTYLKEPTAEVADDEVLICCAVPAKPDGDGVDRVQLDL